MKGNYHQGNAHINAPKITSLRAVQINLQGQNEHNGTQGARQKRMNAMAKKRADEKAQQWARQVEQPGSNEYKLAKLTLEKLILNKLNQQNRQLKSYNLPINFQ